MEQIEGFVERIEGLEEEIEVCSIGGPNGSDRLEVMVSVPRSYFVLGIHGRGYIISVRATSAYVVRYIHERIMIVMSYYTIHLEHLDRCVDCVAFRCRNRRNARQDSRCDACQG